MFSRILVPTDGSDLSEAAARKAVAFAKSVGASVCGFHAMRHSAILASGMDFSVVPTREDAENAARSLLSVIERTCEEAGVPCECFVDYDEWTYRAIIQAAEDHDCDLIFMGSHGRGAMSSLVLGSVTQQVMSHSFIPVLVYRDEKAANRMRQVVYESRQRRI
jgi:nucleotide-binding universal stress UspA family protein